MQKSLQQRMNANESFLHQNRSMQTEIRHFFKIIILGNVSVGKTSILQQFLEESFDESYSCTISADYKSKSLLIDDNTWVEMNIWDTCGQEKYKTLTRQYYREARGCILVFDVADKKSFADLDKWIEDLKEYGDEDITITIVGNKADLEKERVISFKEGEALAKKLKFDYIEVSAKTGLNINILFEILCKSMIQKNEDVERKRPKRRIDYNNTTGYYIDRSNFSTQKEKKSGCC